MFEFRDCEFMQKTCHDLLRAMTDILTAADLSTSLLRKPKPSDQPRYSYCQACPAAREPHDVCAMQCLNARLGQIPEEKHQSHQQQG
jgi:hypothetical protein